jgi:hypothetical protein
VISRISCKNAHRQCVVQWFDSQQKLLIIWWAKMLQQEFQALPYQVWTVLVSVWSCNSWAPSSC